MGGMSHEAALTDLLLGTDLVSLARLRRVQTRHGEAFFKRVLTDSELAYCQKTGGDKRPDAFIQRAAGRIAMKEAVSKALGVGVNGLGWENGIRWHEVELLSTSKQPPRLQLHGRAAERAASAGIRSWRISLSHDGDYAMATAIGLR